MRDTYRSFASHAVDFFPIFGGGVVPIGSLCNSKSTPLDLMHFFSSFQGEKEKMEHVLQFINVIGKKKQKDANSTGVPS